MLDFNVDPWNEPDFSQYYRGPEKPFDSFYIPPQVYAFLDQLKRANDHYSEGRTIPPRQITQVVLFGGVALDQKIGLPSKDYDLYICAPQLVSEIQDYSRDYSFEEILGTGKAQFPLVVHEDGFHYIRKNDLLGRHFGVNGLFVSPEDDGSGLDYDSAKKFDICFGEREVRLEAFSATTSAPILSVMSSVYPEDGGYAYHKAFNEQADARVLCTPWVNSRDLQEKAARKGFQIMTPQQWGLAKRDGQKPGGFNL